MNYSLAFDCLFICVSVKPAGVLTRKIMFDFKRFVHQTAAKEEEREGTISSSEFKKQKTGKRRRRMSRQRTIC